MDGPGDHPHQVNEHRLPQHQPAEDTHMEENQDYQARINEQQAREAAVEATKSPRANDVDYDLSPFRCDNGKVIPIPLPGSVPSHLNPNSAQGYVPFSHRLPPFWPDYYRWFDLDPRTPTWDLHGFFKPLLGKINTLLDHLQEEGNYAAPIGHLMEELQMPVKFARPMQVKYLENLRGKVKETVHKLLSLSNRSLYDTAYYQLRLKWDMFETEFVRATGCRMHSLSIYEQVALQVLGEKGPPARPEDIVNHHRAKYPESKEQYEHLNEYFRSEVQLMERVRAPQNATMFRSDGEGLIGQLPTRHDLRQDVVVPNQPPAGLTGGGMILEMAVQAMPNQEMDVTAQGVMEWPSQQHPSGPDSYAYINSPAQQYGVRTTFHTDTPAQGYAEDQVQYTGHSAHAYHASANYTSGPMVYTGNPAHDYAPYPAPYAGDHPQQGFSGQQPQFYQAAPVYQNQESRYPIGYGVDGMGASDTHPHSSAAGGRGAGIGSYIDPTLFDDSASEAAPQGDIGLLEQPMAAPEVANRRPVSRRPRKPETLPGESQAPAGKRRRLLAPKDAQNQNLRDGVTGTQERVSDTIEVKMTWPSARPSSSRGTAAKAQKAQPSTSGTEGSQQEDTPDPSQSGTEQGDIQES